MAVFKSLLSTALLGGMASAAVVPRAYSVPSDNGFPNPSKAQQMAIAEQAGGMLPNSPLPTTLDANSAAAWQLIAVNEEFETSYFTTLLQNITNNEGGKFDYPDKDALMATFKAVIAQEEQHALGARTVLSTAKQYVPEPCKYQFPVDNLYDAVNVAETFTALVLGTLQTANAIFAMEGQPPFVQLVSSVIGQEGEQNGYYRVLADQIPSESPFLTNVPASMAFSALQMFIVPGSCDVDSKIPIPILPGIMTNGGPIAMVKPQDQTLTFTADLTKSPDAAKQYIGKTSGLYMTYVTGQLEPISVEASDIKWNGNMVSFSANFPYSENVMQGFNHGSLTPGNDYMNATAAADVALAGPAIIQVMNPLH